ncbi:MAG: hypothetical protein KIT62_16210 [Cyclobacteriaceae bacterium]|nr:hypothetical protein [Cyclobacteriaceae bacterium]
MIIFLSACAYGQPLATSFQNATESKGISIDSLDKVYKSALHADTAQAAFNGREQEFIKGYTSLLKDLAGFLKANNFMWEKTIRCFNRIYLNKNGKIDYFLFHFMEGEITPAKQARFEKLLGSFIENYQFPLTSTVHFAQCSPVKYSD